MLSKLLKNRTFISIINKFFKSHNELLDIILFGSHIRGKRKPGDVDILLLFKEKENLDTSQQFRKAVEKFSQVQVTTKTYDSLLNKNFRARESFLSEGFSLVRKVSISESLGYTNNFLFRYSIKNLNQSKRMQLQYALYGRDRKSGIVKELKLKKFADTIFLCPPENSERFKEFFNFWNIKYLMHPILIPSRIS